MNVRMQIINQCKKVILALGANAGKNEPEGLTQNDSVVISNDEARGYVKKRPEALLKNITVNIDDNNLT